MNILFVEPSFPEIHADDSVFPFGYAVLGAVLQQAGHHVNYIFPSAGRFTMENVLERVVRSDAQVVGIGGLLPYLSSAVKFSRRLKEARPDIRLVVGGPMVTYLPEAVLRRTGADFCIAGEGELALRSLVDCLEEDSDYGAIPGLVFERERQIINNGSGEIMPFEDMPMPRWEDFPMEYYLYSDWYLPSWSRTGRQRVFAWLLSRGCPMKCNFCASGCAPRYKTVEQSMTEIETIVDRFDPDYLMFVDNFLMRNRSYITQFCEALIARRFRFRFSLTGRVNMVNEELLALLKDAGCQMIFYGLESANDGILKFMKKGITAAQSVRAIGITKKAGIYPMVSIMFGQPGENFDHFFNSLRAGLSTTNPHDPAPNVASVMPLLTFPGTGLFHYARELGFFDSDEDYLEKYGHDFFIPYTGYSREAVTQAVGVANNLYQLKYHKSMARRLRRVLTLRRLFAFVLRFPLLLKAIRWVAAANPRVRGKLAPLVGEQRLQKAESIDRLPDAAALSRFISRCVRKFG